ncbi:MAG: hypothetical protein WCI04_02465 [archaeon]
MSILKNLEKASNGLFNMNMIQNEVAKQWRKKASCLENLTNENKNELDKLELKLLKGLTYEKQDADKLWKELKESENITPEQNKFAKYLYEIYPHHSIGKLGFD